MNQFEQLKDQVAKAKVSIFGELDAILSATEEDAQKFYEKDVASAGNRLKKKMQDVRKAIKQPAVKASMKAIQDTAKNLRGAIIEKNKAAAKVKA